MRGVNRVQNVGDVLCRGPGGRSPPEAEAILDVYMHNFDLILNYFPPLQILGTCPPVPQGLRVCELAI